MLHTVATGMLRQYRISANAMDVPHSWTKTRYSTMAGYVKGLTVVEGY